MAKALAPTDGRRNCGNYNCRRTWLLLLLLLLPFKLQHRTTKSELRVAQWQAPGTGTAVWLLGQWILSKVKFRSLPKRQLYAARDACAASWVAAAFRFYVFI